LKASILYLTYDGLHEPLGQSQILPYLEGLAKKGYEITVISFEKPSFAKALEDKRLKVQSSELRIVQLKYHKWPPVLSTLYDIYLLKRAVEKELTNNADPAGGRQFDIIHCRSYITSLVGLWAKKKYGIKFIFDMRGFWADERVEGGLWNLKNPIFKWIYQFFKRKEKLFLLESDAIISLTHNSKNEIENKILSDARINRSTDSPMTIKVIPTCTELELFNPNVIATTDKDQLRGDLDIRKDDFVLLYLGSLGTWYMLEEMLDFYEDLKAKRLEVNGSTKFLFLTREKDEIIKALKRRKLNEKEFVIASSPRRDVPKYISICDASIFFILPTYSKKASSATKMGEVMAMGKPVITNIGWGDVEAIIPKAKSGVLVRKLSPSGYQKVLEDFIANDFDPHHIRAQAKELFSMEKGVEQYDEIYKSLSLPQ